jgi:AcrR family transcriptional regulator
VVGPAPSGTCFNFPMTEVLPAFDDADQAPGGALARNQAARRRRVIEATLELASRGGFEAVQMRDVAAAAGVALGTVYRYFASKERLLLEANVEQIEVLGERLQRKPPAGETAADRVIDVLARANRALQRRPEATAAMVRALGRAQPDEAEAVGRVTEGMTAIIVAAMHEGAATARDLHVARALQQIWFSSLIGWVGGVDPAERVDADLATAVRLLLV